MTETIKAIRMRPGEEPEEISLDNKLEAFQREVGGHIETFRLDRDVTAIVNEEGKLEELAPNCVIRGDLIVGPILLCGIAGENFASLPEGYAGLWLDALERARERALPLIREWERGL